MCFSLLALLCCAQVAPFVTACSSPPCTSVSHLADDQARPLFLQGLFIAKGIIETSLQSWRTGQDVHAGNTSLLLSKPLQDCRTLPAALVCWWTALRGVCTLFYVFAPPGAITSALIRFQLRPPAAMSLWSTGVPELVFVSHLGPPHWREWQQNCPAVLPMVWPPRTDLYTTWPFRDMSGK